MIDFSSIQKVFFLGIGGIGMSALARWFHGKGVEVCGYDRTATPLTDALIAEGMTVIFDSAPEYIPTGCNLIIYTPAIPKDHPQLVFFKENNFPLLKRSEALGQITANHFTIAIAGSHGKTTVTAMIAHLLQTAGLSFTAFLGGIMREKETNFFSTGEAIFLLEADEYDRSFLQLNPDIAVITSIDSDHLDVYGSIEQVRQTFGAFVNQVKPNGKVIAHSSVKLENDFLPENTLTYGSAPAKEDFCLTSLSNQGWKQQMTIEIAGSPVSCTLSIPGKHNAENALAALAVAATLNIPIEVSTRALETFPGVARRFEPVLLSEELVYIDDYAHHPTEISSFLKGVRRLYPNRKITAIFQPHLYSRTRDLAAEFGQSLNLADEVYLLPLYPAREKPIPGVDESIIADFIDKPVYRAEFSTLPTLLLSRKPQVLTTIGAGDIDRMIPILGRLFTTSKPAKS